MRFAVVGVGGAGGYFGATLAAAGHEVALVARGEHLAAIRRAGLELERPDGTITIEPSIATDDPREVGVVDYVFLGVKAWQVTEAARAAAPMIGPATAVIPLQNGVEAAEQISAVLGREHAVGATTRIISLIAGPGRIKHVGVEPTLELGELDGSRSARLTELDAVLSATGRIKSVLSADVRVAIWTKFLFITSWSGVGAVVRLPVGVIRGVPQTRALVEVAMQEIARVAVAHGIRLPHDAPSMAMSYLDTMPAQGTTSMQRDVVEGRPSEMEHLTGAAVRFGKVAGIPTPTHCFIYQALVAHELRARGERP